MKYQHKIEGEFRFLNSVNVSGFTKESLSDLLIKLSDCNGPESVSLIGVPAAVLARKKIEIRELYSSSSLCVIDGMPIVKKLRRLGENNERCSAPDFMPFVFEKSIEKGKTHFFYGGKNFENLKKMIANIRKKYPGIKIVGFSCPPFRSLTLEEDNALINEINEKRPDFIWVGIGAPKQEKWIYQHLTKINHGVLLGVGASFDFFSETLKKAPGWIENLSLEWLFRFIKEPKRLFKRYIIGGIEYCWFLFVDFITGTTRKNDNITKEKIRK